MQTYLAKEKQKREYPGQKKIKHKVSSLLEAVTVFLMLCGALCSLYLFFYMKKIDKNYKALLPSTELEIEIVCAKKLNFQILQDTLPSEAKVDLHTLSKIYQNSEVYNQLLKCIAMQQEIYRKKYEQLVMARGRYRKAFWITILCTILLPFILFVYKNKQPGTKK